jgi:hypothetical protein
MVRDLTTLPTMPTIGATAMWPCGADRSNLPPTGWRTQARTHARTRAHRLRSASTRWTTQCSASSSLGAWSRTHKHVCTHTAHNTQHTTHNTAPIRRGPATIRLHAAPPARRTSLRTPSVHAHPPIASARPGRCPRFERCAAAQLRPHVPLVAARLAGAADWAGCGSVVRQAPQGSGVVAPGQTQPCGTAPYTLQ